MTQNEVNLEVIERLTRMEQKLDSHISSRPCEKNSSRIAALEQKFWIASGMIVVIGSITGYIASKIPLLSLLAGAIP